MVKHVVAAELPGLPQLVSYTFSDLLSGAPGPLSSELRVFVIDYISHFDIVLSNRFQTPR